jgi:uncharacterized membrane protein YtjA (UPF0391 family)
MYRSDRPLLVPASGMPAAASPHVGEERDTMLRWAAVFFLIAIVAAVFGFTGIAVGAAAAAKITFVVFLVLAGISLLLGRRFVA